MTNQAINIHFFKEGIRFPLHHQRKLQKWIDETVRHYGFRLNEINYIFCNDRYLLRLNKIFLHHHYYTDIITFDNSTEKKKITADIFISCERVKINAVKYETK